MKIDDLLDTDALQAHVEARLVNARRHPHLPLTIYNYSAETTWSRTWNEITMQCRGLVVDDDGVVVARAYRKFFNHSEADQVGDLDLSAPVEVTEKEDGSLGVLLFYAGQAIVATRGSFTSDQALHATALYQRQYADRWQPQPGLTYLMEIIAPFNRIVLDYGAVDDLIHLGAVDIATGRIFGPLPEWPGPRVEVYPHRTLAEALQAPPRENAEGYVIRFLDTGQMTKLKFARYLELHRAVTGLNARVVWENCSPTAKGLQALLEVLPDEFQQWAIGIAENLNLSASLLTDAALSDYQRILDALPDGWTRKDFALAAQASPQRALLFLLLDDRDIAEAVWKQIKPSGEVVPRVFSEDTA